MRPPRRRRRDRAGPAGRIQSERRAPDTRRARAARRTRVARGTRDRRAGARRAAGPTPRCAAAARPSRGHGASGLMKSSVSGETPPQSLSPERSSSSSTCGRQVRRRLDVRVGTEDQARQRHPARHLRIRDRRHVAHRRVVLRVEGLHDRLLDVAEAIRELADREQRVDALLRRLADAEQDPAGERDAELAGLLVHAQAHGGILVRAVVVSHALVAQAGLVLSSIRPSEAFERFSSAISSARRMPALVCGSMPSAKPTSQACTRYSAVLAQPACGEPLAIARDRRSRACRPGRRAPRRSRSADRRAPPAATSSSV